MLKSSKTWPSIITMTVVQLKFDKKGKYSYSTIANIGESDKPQVFPQPQLTSVLNERSPFKKKLDAQYPHNCDHKEEILARKNLTSQQLSKTSMSRRQKNDLNATITKPTVTTPTGKICLCELELNGIHNNRKRSESLKIDNWDYVYKEKSFRTNSDQPQDEKNPKSPPNCNHGYLSGLGAQKIDTIFRHYYPESGFAWVILTVAILIAILAHGLQLVSVLFLIPAQEKFKMSKNDGAGLASFSTAVAWFFSPLTIGLCKRKSTRVTAVLGGLIISLGCLFTSFATQFHQLYFSYGIIFGLGVGISRDCSSVMVGQYFKRKREFVEILIVVGSGMGIVVMSTFVKNAIEAIGWRLGMQAVTICIGGIFILATCYRSASLYHPQRRAILHLKNQKRKIKDKSHKFEGPPFFDFSTLKSKTFRILLLSTTITAFGINTPLFYLAHHLADNVKDKVLTLHIYLGCAWMLGCSIFGLLVVKKSVDCRIAKQYLCQAAILICGLAMLMLTTVEGNYQTYLFFVWVYGVFVGGYHYSLKMLTFEKVRARNFAQAWGFVQFSQALPIALGVPFAGYLNSNLTENSGYYFCSASSIVGSLTLFLIDFHKRNVPSPKEGITEQNSQTHSCTQECRKLSFQNHQPVLQTTELIPAIKFVPSINVVLLNATNGEKPELTCISEEV